MDSQSREQDESFRFGTVLVVDDESSIVDAISLILRSEGYRVTSACNGREALEVLSNSAIDLVISDIQMPEMDGMTFLVELQKTDYRGIVVIMSAYATIDTALLAIKRGAFDYIAKPFRVDEILLTIRKAEERERLILENRRLREKLADEIKSDSIIARSASMARIFDIMGKVAPYHTSVLISGESGTGKELIARAIHENSPRRRKPFVAINCGAIPENLLESELFGHKRGAFTDATRDKKGLLEEASGGTVFLDEIGEMPAQLQVKLLRVLQEGSIRPVGGSDLIPINVRVLAATLRDIDQDVKAGRFRDDLYYRLNVVHIRVPPLRERRDDIPPLISHFVAKHRKRLDLPIVGVSEAAMEMLYQYSWPGNVRELENCIERAMILTDGERISVESLPSFVIQSGEDSHVTYVPEGELSIKNATRKLEETLILKVLKKTKGNKTHAAKMLEISHRTLLYKLKEYGIDDSRFE